MQVFWAKKAKAYLSRKLHRQFKKASIQQKLFNYQNHLYFSVVIYYQ